MEHLLLSVLLVPLLLLLMHLHLVLLLLMLMVHVVLLLLLVVLKVCRAVMHVDIGRYVVDEYVG